jgi:hypothetical protein
VSQRNGEETGPKEELVAVEPVTVDPSADNRMTVVVALPIAQKSGSASAAPGNAAPASNKPAIRARHMVSPS